MAKESQISQQLSETNRIKLENELRLGFEKLPVSDFTIGELARILTLFNHDLVANNKRRTERKQELNELEQLLKSKQENR